MASTFDNNLRLREMGTGDESGTWGARTNENLELIGEALGFGTEAVSGTSHATTVADGSTDPGRAMYLKYTGSLSSACTITLGPDTISKLWFIENATSGSQNIIIKQGSGSTVTIAAGSTKLVYSEGTGSGASVIDGLDKIDLGTNAKLDNSGIASADSTTTFTNKTFDANATGNSITNIENADISATAAIAFSKLADLTASRALVSDSNGDVSASAVTSTELGYLDGVTSAIQTQLDAKTTQLATLQAVYPVGAIYISVSSTNPASIFGFGTWVTTNTTGRMLIGVQSSNSRWDTALETGGDEEITLNENQIPSHRHGGIYPSGASGGYSQAFDVDHPQTGADLGSQKYTTYTGGGQPHDNMPPFVAVYMWQRTA